jgi:hypothetical protein
VTSFSDDFSRADSTSLGAGWVEVSGDWSIISNRLSSGNAGGTVILRAAGAMATSDHSVTVTIAATAAVSHGIWARGNSNISQGYLWRNDGTGWTMFSVVGGSFTSIGSFAGAAVAGDVAKLEAVGSAIKGYVNGTLRVSVTDTAVTTGTSVGLRAESTSSLRFDDFVAADVTAGATLGISSSTETAQPLTGTKSATLTQAAETSTAQTLVGAKAAALSLATEQGAAQALTGAKTTTLSPATETGAAQTLAGAKAGTLTQAAEQDAAQALSGAKAADVGTAGATESAQPLTGTKTATLGTASAQDTAQALSGVKAGTLGTAGAVEEAQPLTAATPSTTLTPASSIETAQPLTGFKTATLRPALEVGTARPLGVQSTTAPSPDRTFQILAERRQLTVVAEQRRLTVPAENRTLIVR